MLTGPLVHCYLLFYLDSNPQTYLLPDLQSPFAQRLRLLVFAPFAIEHGQVVERGCHGRMVFAQRLLPDGQGVV